MRLRPKHKTVSVLGWRQVEEMVADLAGRMLEKGSPFDVIVAISKGGLIPAALLADRLSIKQVESVYATHYVKGTTERSSQVTINRLPLIRPDLRYLIVDDLIESGDTLETVTQLFLANGCKNLTIAVLIQKSFVNILGNISIWSSQRYSHDSWIIFPWEHTEFKNMVVTDNETTATNNQ